jgi:hypothetical protein
MLIVSLALLHPGAAWSEVPVDKKPATKSKTAAKSGVRKKTALAPKKAVATKAKPIAAAVVQNPYLPGSNAPLKTGPNPYLPDSPPQAAAPNPYLPAPIKPLTSVVAAAPHANVVASAPVSAPVPAAPLTLALSQSLTQTPPVKAPETAPAKAPEAVAIKPVQALTPPAPAPLPYQPAPNPYLMHSYAYSQTTTIANPLEGMSLTLTDFKQFLPSLPSMPSLADISILPTLKKVYPTGEKPLYVLTFKCPTEVIGITPIPTKALHWLVTAGMDAINASDLLPFNMQQVCQ